MRFRTLIPAIVLFTSFLGGCKQFDEWRSRDKDRPTTPVQKVTPEQLVGYLNGQAARLQTLTYGEVRMSAREGIVPYPTLRGNLAASQPRNFRMTGTGGAMGAKLDFGSNPEQFWVYLDAPTVKPMYVFASHSDFDTGRARLPGNIPFEPDWVLQALGMITFPPNQQYSASVDERERTYTLSWPATTPNGMAVRKEVVFNADDSRDGRPQVKKHLIRDPKSNKVICSAEVKSVRYAPTASADPRAAQGAPLQYPAEVVLRWEEQKFEMTLTLESGQVNQVLSEEQARRLFNRPTIAGATPINLAEARFDAK